jgi:methanogenic corrinoid protein MtbC1
VIPARPQPAEYVARIIAAAEEYRVADYDRLAAEARERLAPDALIRDVFSPVLHEAGDRWESGRFTVVQEHMLTSALRRQLAYALDHHNRAAFGPSLAFTTLAGERHELGSLMLAVLAASRGFRALWLGPDLPVADIGRFCGRVAVGAVALSVVTSPEVIDAPRQLHELRQALPLEIAIWLGGRAAVQMGEQALPENTVLIADLADFERRLAGLGPRSAAP